MQDRESIEAEVTEQSESKCPMYDSTTKTKQQQNPIHGFVSDDPQLPKREIAFYLVALVSIIAYAGHGFYLTYGINLHENLPAELLKPGWMRDFKDGSADALLEKSTENWKNLLVALAGFLLVSKASLATAPIELHYLVCSAYALMLVFLAVSFEAVLWLIVAYFVTLCLAYWSFLAVWIFVGSLLYVMNSHGAATLFLDYLNIDARNIAVDGRTASLVAWRACRLVFWYCILEIIYHNLPVGTYLDLLSPDDAIVYKHLAFAMFFHGQIFMLLYVQYYGWPAALALLDGIQLFHWPDCISWVYSYSIMWRVFDRGLFAMMRSHLYIPLGGSRHGPVRQMLAIMATFAFISLFHGDSTNVRAWAALNFCQLLIERCAAFVYYSHARSIVKRYLSPQNEKRLIGYIIAWNMMASCGIIFFFLSGMNGFIIFPEFLLLRSNSRHTPAWHMLTMQFAAYCAVQIGRYYEAKLKPSLCKHVKE
uniref:Protein-cysteine N-palmitoyltransferase HHAT n=1 Tax=Macrostomum lignano TaxID=282301 RepID=A0A1I8HVA3_9PLAT